MAGFDGRASRTGTHSQSASFRYGGSATQTLYDDGTHGDVTNGNNVFSFQHTIPSATTAGAKNLPIGVSDGQARSGNGSISLTVSCPTITVAPSSLTGGLAGSAFSQSITASGGIAPYSYAVTVGSLPAGLNLTSGGLLSETLSPSGNFNFTITATDSNGCTGTRAYSISITCPTITITPSAISDDTLGKSYNQSLVASGGTVPYTYSVTSGSLPGGLSLTSGGLLSGTFTVAGSFGFTVTATDTFGCTGPQAYSFNIIDTTSGPPDISVVVSLNQRWNIVSNPVLGSNDSVNVLFPNSSSSAFGFTGGSYQQKAQLENGFGYWLKFQTAQTETLIGFSRDDDTVDVSAGWNIVGSLSNVIPVSGVIGLGTTVQSSFFGYQGAYVASD